MEKLGGRVQPASGSMDGYKSDGRVYGKLRVETKYTQNDTFRLDIRELFKVASECTEGEVGIMVVDFLESNTARVRGRYVIMPFNHFEKVNRAETPDDS